MFIGISTSINTVGRPSAAITPTLPTINTPILDGVFESGEVIKAIVTATGSPRPIITFLFQSSVAGDTWSDLQSSTSDEYTISLNDVGKMIRVQVKAVNSEGETSWISSVNSATVTPPTNLNKFYGVGDGKISIHLSSDNVTKNTEGKVTHIGNKGGAGPYFDATVTGTPLTANENNTLSLQTSGGYPILSTPADLFNVRFMFVIDFSGLYKPSAGSTVNLFGSTSSIIRKSSNGTATAHRFQVWSNQTGSNLTLNTSLHNLPESGLHLVEVEMSTSGLTNFVDGVAVGSSANTHGWTNFYIDRIGLGTSESARYDGQIGDLLGVTLGEGSAEAIQAARLYLNSKHNLGLVL